MGDSIANLLSLEQVFRSQADAFREDGHDAAALMRSVRADEIRAAAATLQSQEALILSLKEALEPFAECAAPFGEDWPDNQEIACEPFDEGDGAGNGHLLFTFKVGHFRNARKAHASIGEGGMRDINELGRCPSGRSAALRAEPLRVSGLRPAATNARSPA